MKKGIGCLLAPTSGRIYFIGAYYLIYGSLLGSDFFLLSVFLFVYSCTCLSLIVIDPK